METIFKPYKSYAGIAFGASRNELRSLLGKYQEFKKSPFSKNTTDDFGDFHVYYSEDNLVEAIEVFGGKVTYNGEAIFPATVSAFLKLMETIDSEAVQQDYEISSKVLGCCVSISDDAVDGIILCSTDYFERLI